MSSTLDFINAQKSLTVKKTHIEMEGVASAILSDKSRASGISLWPEPRPINDIEHGYDNIRVFDKSRNDLLSKMSLAISEQMQFPVDSVFLHGLGVMASAMTKSFKYEYYGSTSPVTIYVVTAQPPSTGKSGVNGAFFHPVRIAFDDFNDKQKRKRGKIEGKLISLKKDIKSAPKNEIETLARELDKLEDQLETTPIYSYSVSDSTPEALTELALKQNGLFNVISDEGTAITSLLGSTYSSDKNKTNAEAILKGWDGEYISSARVLRGHTKGFIRGSVAVLAQDEAVQTILELAVRGNGVAERFFLLREKNMLGERDHTKFKGIDNSLKSSYSMLISKLVHNDDFTFKISPAGMKLIVAVKIEYEPLMADNKEFSSSLLRGVAGKMDKRVLKTACVLHVAEHWNSKGGPDTISAKTIQWAINICKALMSAYQRTATSSGFVGSDAECQKVIEAMIRYMNRGKMTTTPSQLRDNVKNIAIFKDIPKLSSHLSVDVIPRLVEMGYCCVVKKQIYINPRLRNM